MRRQSGAQLLVTIHTPTPATPLCTPIDTISPGLIHERIAAEPAVQYTVASRARVVRDLLAAGAEMHVLFAKGGLAERNPQQQATYRGLLAEYPKTLHSQELTTAQLAPEMIGATHVLRLADGKTITFFIQATQANAPADDATWHIGLGALNDPALATRVQTVQRYLNANGSSIRY